MVWFVSSSMTLIWNRSPFLPEIKGPGNIPSARIAVRSYPSGETFALSMTRSATGPTAAQALIPSKDSPRKARESALLGMDNQEYTER